MFTKYICSEFILYEHLIFAFSKTKAQISCVLTAQLINLFKHLYFCYIDSTLHLLLKSKISSLWPSSVAVQPVLCRTWSEKQKTGFLVTQLCLVHCLWTEKKFSLID